MLTQKQLRKSIRGCLNESALKFSLENIERQGYKFKVRRRGEYHYFDICDLYIDNKVRVLLPPALSCSFKDIKTFSYNIIFELDKNSYDYFSYENFESGDISKPLLCWHNIKLQIFLIFKIIYYRLKRKFLRMVMNDEQ